MVGRRHEAFFFHALDALDIEATKAPLMDHLIEPAAFGRMLKTGGPAHGGRVSAVWYQAGRTFAASHGNVLLAEFVQ